MGILPMQVDLAFAEIDTVAWASSPCTWTFPSRTTKP